MNDGMTHIHMNDINAATARRRMTHSTMKAAQMPYWAFKTQRAEPFGAETAMPGNWFLKHDLTTPFRAAALEGFAALGEAIVAAAWEILEDVDEIDHERLHPSAVRGTWHFIWHRWGIGAWGEARVIDHGEMDLHPNPDQWAAENTRFTDAAVIDRQMGIDLIERDGTTHQVKVADRDHRPAESDRREADHLWWVEKETGKVRQIA